MPEPFDREKHKHVIPYATARYGVFQPLIGWNSKRLGERLAREQVRLLNHAVAGAPVSGVVGVKAFESDDSDTPALSRSEPREWPTTAGAAKSQDANKKVNISGKRPARPAAVSAAAKARTALGNETMKWLEKQRPDLMQALTPRVSIDGAIGVTALAQPDYVNNTAVLSPVGLLHQYRQYFFELDSFLGPSIEHVWLSPGASLELLQTHTRRFEEQRTSESLLEQVRRQEATQSTKDDLAQTMSQQTTNNTQLGIAANARVSYGVFSASASTNYNTSQAVTQANQSVHSQTREQSSKVSEEIRQSLKITVRTTTETIDTNSRRYVLQNNTPNLLNYELRRKMRRIGVQTQHIGAQLCWVLYVENPGDDLGLGQLVHWARPSDGAQAERTPPEAPVVMYPRDVTIVVSLNGLGESIEWEVRDVDVSSQIPTGWKLDPTVVSYDTHDARLLHALRKGDTSLAFQFHNDSGDDYFTGQVALSVHILPPDQTTALKEYEKKRAAFTQESARKSREEYLTALKERVTLSSSVRKRPGHDMREEERTVVFRHIIRDLITSGDGSSPPSTPVLSEIVRSMFDVESMLYFVAPEWWRPRARPERQRYGNAPSGLDDDAYTVSWGSSDPIKRRPDYLVTEESEPAPAGASLGWLLQLDGDAHRNAFLNTPWVKAVVPIRPGQESRALEWLKAHAEGGFDENAVTADGMLLGEAITKMIQEVQQLNRGYVTRRVTEKLYENGFDPLGSSFQTPRESDAVFDEWVEVVATDQVVAVPYVLPSSND